MGWNTLWAIFFKKTSSGHPGYDNLSRYRRCLAKALFKFMASIILFRHRNLFFFSQLFCRRLTAQRVIIDGSIMINLFLEPRFSITIFYAALSLISDQRSTNTRIIKHFFASDEKKSWLTSPSCSGQPRPDPDWAFNPIGLVVIASADWTEDFGFESHQGVRFLGI
jgi:hypothetical protein